MNIWINEQDNELPKGLVFVLGFEGDTREEVEEEEEDDDEDEEEEEDGAVGDA